MLMDKKSVSKLGSRMNDNAASKPSAFAMKLMEKMGWKEGQGLGKNEDGMTKHIVLQKRDDNVGLGLDNSAAADAVAENWWHNSFSSNLLNFKKGLKVKDDKKKSKKDKKDKKDKKKKDKKDLSDDDEHVETAPPSYDELFKATGGARLGMRARMDQKGKWKRTEQMEKEEMDVYLTKFREISGETPSTKPDSAKDSLESSSEEASSKKDKKDKKRKKDKKPSSKESDEEEAAPKSKKQKK